MKIDITTTIEPALLGWEVEINALGDNDKVFKQLYYIHILLGSSRSKCQFKSEDFVPPSITASFLQSGFSTITQEMITHGIKDVIRYVIRIRDGEAKVRVLRQVDSDKEIFEDVIEFSHNIKLGVLPGSSDTILLNYERAETELANPVSDYYKRPFEIAEANQFLQQLSDLGYLTIKSEEKHYYGLPLPKRA